MHNFNYAVKYPSRSVIGVQYIQCGTLQLHEETLFSEIRYIIQRTVATCTQTQRQRWKRRRKKTCQNDKKKKWNQSFSTYSRLDSESIRSCMCALCANMREETKNNLHNIGVMKRAKRIRAEEEKIVIFSCLVFCIFQRMNAHFSC